MVEIQIKRGLRYAQHAVMPEAIFTKPDEELPDTTIFKWCESEIDPLTGESEICQHGYKYKWGVEDGSL